MTKLEFAQRLKQYRKAKNLTQQELADRLGVSNKSVSRWGGSYPDVALLGQGDWQNLPSFFRRFPTGYIAPAAKPCYTNILLLRPQAGI